MVRLWGSMERAWGRQLALKDDWSLFQLSSTLSLGAHSEEGECYEQEKGGW